MWVDRISFIILPQIKKGLGQNWVLQKFLFVDCLSQLLTPRGITPSEITGRFFFFISITNDKVRREDFGGKRTEPYMFYKLQHFLNDLQL